MFVLNAEAEEQKISGNRDKSCEKWFQNVALAADEIFIEMNP